MIDEKVIKLRKIEIEGYLLTCPNCGEPLCGSRFKNFFRCLSNCGNVYHLKLDLVNKKKYEKMWGVFDGKR